MIEHFSIFQPNAWDNSVAPINIIHKLINDLNKLVDEVNNIEDTSFERAKEYTDSQISPIRFELGTIGESLRSISRSLGALTSDLMALDSRESSHYAETVSRLNNLSDYIQSVRAELKNYTDLSIIMLRNQLEEEIEELKELINSMLDLPAIDGHTGQFSTVRRIIGTWGVSKNRYIGANRYALTWGQLKTSTPNGWLANNTSRFNGKFNYIAPTWHNFMINNHVFTSTQTNNLNSCNLNTWQSFCNLTLLFIGDMVHKINQYCTSGTATIADNYKNVDVFKKSEWDAYISDGTPAPTIERVNVTDLYDGSNTHVSLIVTQFKSSIGIFTGAVLGYGLYASSSTANALFATSSDLPALIQFLHGNMGAPCFSNTFFN